MPNKVSIPSTADSKIPPLATSIYKAPDELNCNGAHSLSVSASDASTSLRTPAIAVPLELVSL